MNGGRRAAPAVLLSTNRYGLRRLSANRWADESIDMTYVLVGIAVALLAVLVRKATSSPKPGMLVIYGPTLGVLNLAGASCEQLVNEDLLQLSPLFTAVRRSDSTPPICDVLLIYCDIGEDGKVEGSALGVREIVRDAGAAIVVVAKDNPGQAYIAGAPRRPFGQANLVMTLERNGSALPTFLARLFTQMNDGVSMPVAWNRLAPQIPNAEHGGLPGTIFSCERGQVAFRAAQQAVAA